MIDIHCHILPEIDDGPSDMFESIEMSRIAAMDGISTVVATPHIKNRLYPAELIGGKVAELNNRIAGEGISLEVLQGADVNALIDPGLLKSYTINGTGYVLIEFPHSHLPANAREIIFRLIVDGFQPILTHPERNGSVLRDPSLLFRLVESGILVQITADSLSGGFGPEVQRCAIFLLEKGVVSFIASDAHSSIGRRPELSGGLKVAEKILGRERAWKLVSTNPEAVISGVTVGV